MFLPLLLLAAPALARIEIDTNTFGGLEARAIGPAVMGGRIAAIDAVATDPVTIYVGAAGGGVWKSQDDGVTFRPVFDDHIQSIGAIAIDPSDPETVWVGTGESWTRNSVSIGDGVYRSTDGGESWERKGLEESERIARIIVDPTDSAVVWVCATGHLWDANEQRGVFKTTDAGESWERVLTVDEDTGCSDLSMDPQVPDIVYAGMWQFRRTPWSFSSGGPGSGLYKTVDGGSSWSELAKGLPDGPKGRIAVDVAPSRPNRVYAVVEAEKTALYRSDDAGASWAEMNSSMNVAARPFYFATVIVDPVDHERLYKPGLSLGVSTDGGRSVSGLLGGFGGGVHSDHHALWVNPSDPHELLLGTDGGLYQSFDRGAHWRAVKALPISQFYEVAADADWPYNVYGGLQDNGSWTGPSRASGGIPNAAWRNVGFGDGFHVYPDPSDRNVVFAEFQGGQILRYHRDTGQVKVIKPYPAEGEDDFRCSWNTAMHVSPSRPGTLYVGCQYLFRSTDRGESWERISPDLSTDDPEKQKQKESGGLTIDNSTAENHTTIYTISESPLDGDVIWVGTDDGNVQLTRDGGATWTNVVANVPDLPARTWVSFIDASPHDPATAFATFDGHRTGDMAPHVYRTRDFGATWTAVGEGLSGYAHVVRQDPVNPDLLFAGTELGLWISLDGGEGWARFTGNLPPVAVRDLDIHPTEHDLIIGTHGRGIYILDDLTPLRAVRAETLEAKLALLPSRPSVQFLTGQTWPFDGDDQFVGRDLGEVASLFYYQAKRHIFGDMNVEIYDADGTLLTTLPAGKRKGMNRVDWPMRLDAPKIPPATSLTFAFTGPRVPEGTYRYRIVKGKDSYDGTFELVADPRSPYSAEDRRLQQETALALYDALEDLTYLVDALIDLRDQAEARAEAAGGRTAARLEDLAGEAEALRASLVSTSEAGWLSGDEKLREKLTDVFGAVAGYDGRPTESQLAQTAKLTAQVESAHRDFDGLTSPQRLEEASRGLDEPLTLLTREAWEGEEEAAGTGVSVATGWAAATFAPFAVWR
ncbi:MAG: glycosyl hydrolase [Thermoanaerobaculia bacterium]